jgi:hypothetical protein
MLKNCSRGLNGLESIQSLKEVVDVSHSKADCLLEFSYGCFVSGKTTEAAGNG